MVAIGLAISCSKSESNSGTASNSGDSGAGGAKKVFKASDPTGLKLAFVTNNASDFWKIAAAGVHKYEKEAGVQIDHQAAAYRED